MRGCLILTCFPCVAAPERGLELFAILMVPQEDFSYEVHDMNPGPYFRDEV